MQCKQNGKNNFDESTRNEGRQKEKSEIRILEDSYREASAVCLPQAPGDDRKVVTFPDF